MNKIKLLKSLKHKLGKIGISFGLSNSTGFDLTTASNESDSEYVYRLYKHRSTAGNVVYFDLERLLDGDTVRLVKLKTGNYFIIMFVREESLVGTFVLNDLRDNPG